MSETAPEVVLASASAARARLLENAGVAIIVDPPKVDEAEVKRALAGEGAGATAVADTLAELKARHVSRRHRGSLVIGADQVLDCGGTLFDKPADRAHAKAHLSTLRGRTHELVACACVVRDDTRLWHHVDRARLTMRDFSDAFLDDYLSAVGREAEETVGAYKLEGRGVQLFSRVEGDYFTVLGLPLLPLLGFLRGHGVIRQ